MYSAIHYSIHLPYKMYRVSIHVQCHTLFHTLAIHDVQSKHTCTVPYIIPCTCHTRCTEWVYMCSAIRYSIHLPYTMYRVSIHVQCHTLFHTLAIQDVQSEYTCTVPYIIPYTCHTRCTEWVYMCSAIHYSIHLSYKMYRVSIHVQCHTLFHALVIQDVEWVYMCSAIHYSIHLPYTMYRVSIHVQCHTLFHTLAIQDVQSEYTCIVPYVIPYTCYTRCTEWVYMCSAIRYSIHLPYTMYRVSIHVQCHTLFHALVIQDVQSEYTCAVPYIIPCTCHTRCRVSIHVQCHTLFHTLAIHDVQSEYTCTVPYIIPYTCHTRCTEWVYMCSAIRYSIHLLYKMYRVSIHVQCHTLFHALVIQDVQSEYTCTVPYIIPYTCHTRCTEWVYMYSAIHYSIHLSYKMYRVRINVQCHTLFHTLAIQDVQSEYTCTVPYVIPYTCHTRCTEWVPHVQCHTLFHTLGIQDVQSEYTCAVP